MLNTSDFDYQTSVFEILNISGLGILIVDENRQILWSNGQFAQWVGKQPEDIIDLSWGRLPIEAADEQGHRYCLQAPHTAQMIQAQHWSAPLPSQPLNTAHFFHVLQESAQGQDKGTKLAGVAQRASWVQFLEYEVSRSRRYDNPLALLKVKLVVFGKPASPEMDEILSEVLKDELRWADMIGHSEAGEFLVILPETDTSSIAPLVQKIHSALKKKLPPNEAFEFVVGEAHWQKGDSAPLLMERARSHLLIQFQALLSRLQSDH